MRILGLNLYFEHVFVVVCEPRNRLVPLGEFYVFLFFLCVDYRKKEAELKM